MATLLMTALVTGSVLFIFNLLQEREQHRLQHRFGADIAEISVKVSERMMAYAHILKGGRGLFTSSENVTRQAWHEYATSLELERDYPGIQGVGFALYIPPVGLAEHEREVNKEGFDNYHIWPEGKRDIYTGILYLEPFDWRNQRAFGYDMFSELTRREAMERARDTGLPAISGKVLLVQETGDKAQAGTLLYVPVYKIAGSLNTVKQRRQALLGWVYSPYRMDNLIEGILGAQSEEFRLKISDESASEANDVLYDNTLAEGNEHPLIHQSINLKVNGRIWQLHFDALPHYTEAIGSSSFFVEVSGVLLIGILLILLTWNIFNTHRNAELLAKRLSTSLNKSERQFHLVTDDSPVMIAQLDCDKRYTLVNKSYANISGSKPDDLVGKRASEILSEDVLDLANPHMDIALTGQATTYDLYVTTKEGALRVLAVHYYPDFNMEGRVVGFIAFLIDITKRKQAEDALRYSEQRFRDILEAAGEYVWEIDANMVYTYVSNRSIDVKGYTPDELLGHTPMEFMPEEEIQSVGEIVNRAIADKAPFTLQHSDITKSGETLWEEVNGTPFYDSSGNMIGLRGTGLNITKRMQDESEINTLSQVVEQAGESILITDKSGTIKYVNSAFTKLTGYSADEVLGKNPRVLKSGRQSASFYKRMWETILNGNVWQAKLIDKKKDGSLYPGMMTISPIQNQTGDITHFVCMQQDISETEDLENQFHQAQKMQALGTLVGGIAHDFNNMLAGMTGNLYLAKKHAQGLPDVVARLGDVEELSFRSAEMVKQLLTFARKGEVTMKPLLFTSFIKETIKFTSASIPENIELHQDISGEELSVNADITQLHQVLLNLINNARDSLEGIDSPAITIRLETYLVEDDFFEKHPYFAPRASYAHLSVEDNGCGIPVHQLKHVFEPFFTTKQEGKGTGLGLAMSFGAIKTHDGHIEVESAEGKGTIFHVYLPLVESVDSASISLNEGPVQGHGETILVVDDNAFVLKSGREILEDLNYKVLEASDGLEAVDVFSHNQSEVTLIITDLVMPRLGGVEAVKRIRKIRSDVKVIYATGYDKAEALIGDISDKEEVISKPYNIHELSMSIRKKLES